MNSSLAQPLHLPCGHTLPNRLGKSAMTEGLADANGRPTHAHSALYKTWSEGGTGLLLRVSISIASMARAIDAKVVDEGQHGAPQSSLARCGILLQGWCYDEGVGSG